MRSLLAAPIAAVALASLLTLHCGGQVDGASLPDCPSNLSSACPVEANCKQTFTDCAGTHQVACQCDGSKWVCPQLGAPSCAKECSTATQGASCTTKNLQCPMPKKCVNSPSQDMCMCDGSHFVCTTSACPPPPPCPPPSEVKLGRACSMPSSMSCASVLDCGDGTSAAIDCSCTNGKWYCESFMNPCTKTVDAGSSPDGG